MRPALGSGGTSPAIFGPAARSGLGDGQLLVDLARIHNARLPVGLFVVSGLGHGALLGGLVPGAIIITLVVGAANVYNDMADLAIDIDNGRLRPLADGRATKNFGLIALAVMVVGSLTLLPLLQGAPSLGLVLGAAFGAWLYSAPGIRLSDRGWLAPVLLAWLYCGFPALLGAIEAGSELGGPSALIPILSIGMASILLKDVTDEPGDRKFGKRTPVVIHGAGFVKLASIALTVAAILTGVVLVGVDWWLAASTVALAAGIGALDGARFRGFMICFRVAATLAILLLVGNG